MASMSPIDRGGSSTRWSDLFADGRLSVVLVLAGGTLLYAMNMYFTAALMPTIVQDIGGARYYAWVIIGFVLAAMVGTMFVDRTLDLYGARACYVLAFVVFGIGATANALSATIDLLIFARVAQGLGGGFLAGLGYAVIRTVMPERLWARATGITASMWGVGTLVGPLLGGVFAEFGAWRWAYGAVATAAVLLILVARRALPGKGETASDGHRRPVPVASLAVLLLAALTISLSSFVSPLWLMLATIGAGLLLLVVFTIVERRMATTLLPAATYERSNPLKWIYLTAGFLCAGVMIENFIPLFAQHLGGLTPLLAGIFGAVLSAGWVIAQMLVVSVEDPVRRRLAMRAGPVLLASGLVTYGLLQANGAATPSIVLWFVGLFMAGVGIGIAYPFLSVAAMSNSPDPKEARKAAAGLATIQTIAFAVTSSLAGCFMALGGGDPLASARYLTFGIAAITVLGIVAAYPATRGRPAASPPKPSGII